jgi:hypothetical protein
MTEVTGMFPYSDMRPDVVFTTGAKELLCDVITCPSVRQSATSNDCLKGSQIQGFSAAEGVKTKERYWRNSCNLMGYNFVALSHEVGTIGDPALGLLDELANRLQHGNDRQRFKC